MKPISTKIHGIIDYAAGIFLILAPYLFGFSTGDSAHWISELVGAAIIAVSLLTRYELGAIKLILMKVHFILDMAVGAVLLITLFLLDFDRTIVVPFLAIGLAGFIVPSLTRRV